MGSAGEQRGFTFIGLLVTVAVMGLLLTLVARVWSTSEQRERETQLLFAGHAYRLAIGSYFASGHRFPATLEELLQDERNPIPRHHLRRLYPDPMTGKADWTLVLTPDGQGIMGVASSAKVAPLKRRNFVFNDQAFTDADCVCLWQFIYYANRFSRGVGQTTATGGALTPANTQSQAPNSIDNFKPGTISALPQGSGSPFAPNSPFGPNGKTSNLPADPSDGGGSN
jgi:type II secretory pathway pseudopilin PulG